MALIELTSPELLLLAPLFITLTLLGHYFSQKIKTALEVFHFPPIRRLARISVKKGIHHSKWRSASLALKLAVIILVTFALAHPTILTFSEVSETVQVPMTTEKDIAGQIVLTVDMSASMGIADVPPSRLEAAKATIIEFVENASGTVRFGVVAFDDEINKTLPITQDKDAVIATIQSLFQGEALPCLEDYTDIGIGLQTAAGLLKPYGSSNQSSAIILVSDGFTNYGYPNPFYSVLRGVAQANEIGVPIHALHVASLGQDSNDELMRQIAQQTKGKFMTSSNLAELRDVLTLMGKFYTPTYEWSSEVEIKTTIPSRTELGFILMFIASAFIITLWIGNYRHYKTSF